jgi:predicted DCC family thiol-disulfide oxidoreductase YuxK
MVNFEKVLNQNNIILFDGNCNFCNYWVNFVLKRDKQQVFKFASLNSEIGNKLKLQHQIPATIDSIVLIKNDDVFIKSRAAIEIARNLSGWWFLLVVFRIVPTFVRDAVYDVVAKNRYRWFGKSVCELPQKLEYKTRFLD